MVDATFVRIYIGFDMVPHFTEKLFAGPGPFGEDVAVFASLGLPIPGAFVVLGGFCEIGIAIGIGLGVLTRLAAPCAVLYFMIATLLGEHFGLGFIWASPGGGWEYPVLMMVLFASFAVTGGGRFSIDHTLGIWSKLPPRLRLLALTPQTAS
ncbi:MAG: DoxX family protein [Pseudomonadota bacterium]